MFDISNYFFFLELSAASLVISLPFYKRDHFGMRLLGAVATILVLSTIVPNGLAKFWLVTGLVCIMQNLCWNISWRKAVYNTLCAYALQHFTYSLVPAAACVKNVFFGQIISPEDLKPGFGISSWILHIVVYAGCYSGKKERQKWMSAQAM